MMITLDMAFKKWEEDLLYGNLPFGKFVEVLKEKGYKII
jgi:hypothetical protein